jgi:hypothetical protein
MRETFFFNKRNITVKLLKMTYGDIFSNICLNLEFKLIQTKVYYYCQLWDDSKKDVFIQFSSVMMILRRIQNSFILLLKTIKLGLIIENSNKLHCSNSNFCVAL